MKWLEDLRYDIRHDNRVIEQDGVPFEYMPFAWNTKETSPENLAALKTKFLSKTGSCNAILEIGVNRNAEESFTQVFIKNKREDAVYVGIDIDDKSYLDDASRNIYTLRSSSSDINANMDIIRKLGVEQFDFIFIDGWHSVGQVLRDWEYTRWLSPTGVVGFHDVTAHPGPFNFVRALNRDKWNVEILCPFDFGIGFVWRK